MDALTKGTPYTFRNHEDAFNQAIDHGHLTVTPGTERYAGLYMYMHSTATHDHFKHIETREYYKVPMSSDLVFVSKSH